MPVAARQLVDIALVIDRMANAEILNERKAFAVAVLDGVAAELGAERVRGAMVAYAVPQPNRPDNSYRHPPVEVRGFGTPDEVALALRDLAPIEGADLRFEAALDQALSKLLELPWRAGSTRVALAVGSRPPLPAHASAERRQPANQGDWRHVLAEVRKKIGLHSIAVLCPIFWPAPGPSVAPQTAYFAHYSATCWADLGYSGMFEAETVSPGHLTKLIALGLAG